ncbi:RNA polymerase subunit sigma-70 [Rhodopirellula sp. MGV]|nr:RNA polymerase subunit sigma-70 [Rhodopirellula sp. MGV]PNY35282.1 RNA polymerase subunit sigma-70 [Rhodopirellula baltica]
MASLTSRIGVQHLADIEDAVQSALMSALDSWTIAGVPNEPSAWLYRVAFNKLHGELRQCVRRRQILRDNVAETMVLEETSDFYSATEAQTDLLKMLFVACDDEIPLQSQLVFALKTLCGFDVREISLRLFTTETNVYKRLSRARSRLQDAVTQTDTLALVQMRVRLPAVHSVLYLLFTEGYLSSNVEMALRSELCDEAMRLTTLLAEHPAGSSPETFALLAMMHLHRSRMSARQDGAGGLLLLEEQDRSLWDQAGIQVGLKWLAASAVGETFTRYHAEAGIAAEHCLAASFAETRWDQVCQCYELLAQTTASPIHQLNHAVAIAEWKSPAEALAKLNEMDPPPWLTESYLWAAVKADLHQRCGHTSESAHYRAQALSAAPTPHLKTLLERRLAQPNETACQQISPVTGLGLAVKQIPTAKQNEQRFCDFSNPRQKRHLP